MCTSTHTRRQNHSPTGEIVRPRNFPESGFELAQASVTESTVQDAASEPTKLEGPVNAVGTACSRPSRARRGSVGRSTIAPNCTWPATFDPADVFDALSELLESTRWPAWHADAVCRGQADLFFPARGQATEPAKAICAGCPARERRRLRRRPVAA